MTEKELRESVVFTARLEFEQWNKARLPDYWEASGLPRNTTNHWCGVFVLYCLKEAGLALDVEWRVGWGFIGPEELPRITVPRPGDIAYLDKPYQHHAVVEELRDDGTLVTVDGNQRNGIERKIRPLPPRMVFYSIQPFIDAHRSDTDPAPPPESEP